MLDDHAFPRTAALRRALARAQDKLVTQDLLFLEAWEVHPTLMAADTLRVHQLRRANPVLANAIRNELRRGQAAMDRDVSRPEPV